MIKYESPPPNICTSILKVAFFYPPLCFDPYHYRGCENEEMELVPRMGDTWEQSLVEEGLTGMAKCTYH